MHWVYLVLAIVFEVLGTTCMKVAYGFTKLLPSILIFVFYGMSLVFLTLALKGIEVSIAYAFWAALGTALVAMIGIVWFRESVSALKIVSLALIIVGVVGLHLSQTAQ